MLQQWEKYNFNKWLHEHLLLHSKVFSVLAVFLSYIAAFVTSYYLQYEPSSVWRTLLFAVIIVCISRCRVKRPLLIKEFVLTVIFSSMLSCSIVVSKHIVLSTGNGYSGLATENYITPYSWSDLFAFIIIAGTVGLLAFSVIDWFKKHVNRQYIADLAPLKLRPLFSRAVVLFLCYIPYLLTYWPGFIFSDSIRSLWQIFGLAPWNNHHPIAYTLFLKCCIKFAGFFGLSNTAGCAFYSVIQMALMSFGFSLLIQWLLQRINYSSKNLARLVHALLFGCFAFTPYIATYTIAMWKDPLFSIGIVVLTILLIDLILTDGTIVHKSKAWIPIYICSLLFIVFFRGNGIVITGMLIIALFILAIRYYGTNKKFISRNVYLKLGVLTGALTVTAIVITGPVYSHFNIIPSEPAETLGVPLNQMARVVVYEGDMSESDESYMNNLMPLEQYASIYCPTCTDMLKSNENFNQEALKSDFFSHWISMFIKNPGLYLESWMLQTFGYWTINQVDVIEYASNISGGVPHLTANAELEQMRIFPNSKLGTGLAYKLFPTDEWSIPLGIVFWIIVLLLTVLVSTSRTRLITALIPSIALMISLFVASPIWYWPRYAAAIQFLLPVYIAIFFIGCRSTVFKKEN